jgi:VanZ family protein
MKLKPLAIGVILLIATTLFFVGGPDHHSPRSLKAFWDLGHIFYFGLLSLLLLRLRLLASQSLQSRWTVILLVSLLTGVLIEILQYGTHREPSIMDVVRDVAGSFIALAFLAPPAKAWPAKSAAVAILLFLLSPLAMSLTDEAMARHNFPVLADFESPFEISRWTGNTHYKISSIPQAGENNSNAQKVLQISLSTTKYSGVALNYFPSDWRGYNKLIIRVYQPDTEPLRITCRIHDLQHARSTQEFHDRYKQSFIVNQGWNDIVIDLKNVETAPTDRSMQMDQIRNLGIFSIQLPLPRLLYIDEVYLSQ